MLGAITMFDRGITIIAILFCWLAGRPVHADDFSGMQDDPFAVAVEQLADGVYVARRSRLDIA